VLLFDFLKDIIYRKKGDLLDNPENHQEFQPYLMQRWLSMHSPNLAKIINATTNRLYTTFETKQDWYRGLLTTIPKTYFKKINYIKKNKKEKENQKEFNEIISFIAKNKQISKREVEMYVDEFNLNIDDIKRVLKGDKIK